MREPCVPDAPREQITEKHCTKLLMIQPQIPQILRSQLEKKQIYTVMIMLLETECGFAPGLEDCRGHGHHVSWVHWETGKHISQFESYLQTWTFWDQEWTDLQQCLHYGPCTARPILWLNSFVDMNFMQLTHATEVMGSMIVWNRSKASLEVELIDYATHDVANSHVSHNFSCIQFMLTKHFSVAVHH